VLDDAHILLCPGPSFNGEHHLVRDAIIKAIDEVAKTAEYGSLEVHRERPLVELSCVEPLTDHARSAKLNGKPANHFPRLTNMDIYVRHIGREDSVFNHNLYDVSFTSPPGGWTSTDASDHAARSRSLDHFIEARERAKFFHFSVSFRPTDEDLTTFYPICFDRSGRAGAATSLRLKYIRDMLIDLSRTTSSRHSVGQALTDRISVALQTGIARHIASTRQLHRRHLLVGAIAAGAPQAQGPAPGGGAGAAGLNA